MSEHAAHHDHSAHYIRIWGILVVLLIVSVIGPVIGEFTGVKAITLITAFGIAVVKASLVIKHFMHTNLEPKFVHYFLITALAFMALFFGAVSPDILNHEGSNWENLAAKSEVERGLAAGSGHGDSHGEGDAHGDAKHAEPAHGGGH